MNKIIKKSIAVFIIYNLISFAVSVVAYCSNASYEGQFTSILSIGYVSIFITAVSLIVLCKCIDVLMDKG